MGSLKSLTYGAIVKAIHDYSKTHQNYGEFAVGKYELFRDTHIFVNIWQY